MVAARSGIRVNPASADLPISQRDEAGRQRLVAAGGILGALAASSCCIVPLILFSLGIGGAWIGNLTALAPYKPLFVAGRRGQFRRPPPPGSFVTTTAFARRLYSPPPPPPPRIHTHPLFFATPY